ncbi:hypothetical protein MW290_28175 [Aquincola tertiaricarbonis]|uniref:Type II toxin-antitoxin system RelE/ParE family toxin n=1 Tax=Aquincola tertiaricarbonis TaxID=391953 RepID=A0ABY4SAF3_AQUTE|nr:hypothetical protein [Aquincola tertiaricarbonis]URI09444.1 hypothetical protein MW290_28175 [Aquincola tertiaricarbonis]
MKPTHRRPSAIKDMVRQVSCRRSATGEVSAAIRVNEMQECLRAISEAPDIGSRRIGQWLGVPELRWKRVGKTELRFFWYVEEASHIDVIRLVSTDQLPRQAMRPDDLH